MKVPISISLEEEMVARLDADRMRSVWGRSGIIRKLLFDYYEMENTQEDGANGETKKEK